jgi:ubiquinone/menaquinone biosynthesis C-methylase UbiE
MERTMEKTHSVCPWWLGYVLASPVRRLFESPERLLGPYVRRGMTVVEPGCGMGYFTIPVARMTGSEGKVICVDLQEKMIAGLLRRARRAGLADRILASVCSTEDLGLQAFRGAADLALAIHMVHEVPDQRSLLAQLHDVLRPGGSLLIREPRGHVSQEAFQGTLALAKSVGLEATNQHLGGKGPGALLRRPA